MRIQRFAAAVLAAGIMAAAAASSASAQSIEIGDGRLLLHGYLTQGVAQSEGANFAGIRDDLSAAFRYAALQARFDRGKDGLLVQLNHRDLGQSLVTDFEPTVRLNWAFYERRFDAGAASLRAGRIPVPRGIYNEQRSIGVLLPMYRAPYGFYDEAAYFSETIDGVVGERAFLQERPWSLDVAAYGGRWQMLQYDQFGPEYSVSRVKANQGAGAQLWVNTPVDGLRLGTAAQRYQWLTDEGTADEERSNVVEFQTSIDWSGTRAMLRTESLLQRYPVDDYWAHYLQAGVQVTQKLWAYGLAEYAFERDVTYLEDPTPVDFDWHRSAGVALNYKFRPNLVAKAEHHWNRSIQVEQANVDYRTPPRFRYFIVSLSAAF